MLMNYERTEYSLWWILIMGLIVVSVPVFWALDVAGLLGNTVAERIIFDNSYQRHATVETRNTTLTAQLAEIDYKLNNSDLNPTQRSELEAKAAGLRILLNSR